MFTGRVIADQREINLINKQGKELDGRLEEAALKAHVVTEALRMKGYEAYEFHDRYASIVTVGSFQSEGSMGLDGKVHLDPEIEAVIEQFKAKKDPHNPRGLPAPRRSTAPRSTPSRSWSSSPSVRQTRCFAAEHPGDGLREPATGHRHRQSQERPELGSCSGRWGWNSAPWPIFRRRSTWSRTARRLPPTPS